MTPEQIQTELEAHRKFADDYAERSHQVDPGLANAYSALSEAHTEAAEYFEEQLKSQAPTPNGSGEIKLRPDWQKVVAEFYGRIPQLLDTVGSENLSARRTVDRLLDIIVARPQNSMVHLCHGHGDAHLFINSQRHLSTFEAACPKHVERRVSVDRRLYRRL